MLANTTVPQKTIDELHQRLERVVWPSRAGGTAQPGFDIARLRPFVERWRNSFDWRAVEAQLGHYMATTADGRRVHAIHRRGGNGKVPILLVHGWPDSPLRFVDLIPRLTAAGYNIVAPAIPGFGFSDEPSEEISPELIANDFHELMTELGYNRYAVHGGDFGSIVATKLATIHPEAVAALHLTDAPFDLAFTIDRETSSKAEADYLTCLESFSAGQMYLNANMQQPDVLALALADSPVGLLAWLAHLYDQWTDEEIEPDHVLANASLLWLTGTVRSSIRIYSEPADAWADTTWNDQEPESGNDATNAENDALGGWSDTGDADAGETSSWAPAKIDLPTAFCLFPHDIAMPPREFVERYYRVDRFTVMPKGGHFAALEQPEVLADDIVSFLEGVPGQPLPGR